MSGMDDLRAAEQARRAGGGDAEAGEAPASARPSGAIGLTWAAAVAAERPRWTWEDRLPEGAVSLLVGRPGLGKTQVLCNLAACVTRGTLPGGLLGKPAVVLIASAEDAQAQVLVPRLIAAEADLTRVAFLDGLSLPDALPALAARVKETAARLLVVDPLVAHIPAEHSTHRDQHVRRVLTPLAALAAERNVAVVGVMHLNKGEAQETLDRVGGSVGLGAAARSVLILGRDPGDDDGERGNLRVLAHAKSNYSRLAASVQLRIETRLVDAADGGTIETSRAVLLGEHAAGANELLSTPSAEERSERDDAREYLEAELAGGPVAVKDVTARARAQGISRTTLYRARSALGLRSVQIGDGSQDKRSAWALPEPRAGVSYDGGETARSTPCGTERGTELLGSFVPRSRDVGHSSKNPALPGESYVPLSIPEYPGPRAAMRAS